MPLFIKTEKFTLKTSKLSPEKRKIYIKEHISWVKKLNNLGLKITSGYLVDQNQNPGGGGLLIFEADCFKEAEYLVKQDPMIMADLVHWELQEWKAIFGELLI